MSNGDDSTNPKKSSAKASADAAARKERRAKAKAAKADAEPDPLKNALPPEKPPAVTPQENEHYAIGEWHEIPMFSCKHCPWSTLNEDEMVKHIADHLKIPSVRRTDTGFVTESGHKIIREEIIDEQEV